jgi:hypothetical protein
MFGLFDPSKKGKALWVLAFIGATLYQIWWDVFMDWELLERLPSRSFRLRSLRLYKSRIMYWAIFGVNCILRFGWTLSFLPQWYLDSSGVLLNTFDGNYFARIIGPAIASAEIVRRMLWGFLRLELEAIKTCGNDPQLREALQRSSSEENGIELTDRGEVFNEIPPIFRTKTSPMPIELRSDMSSLSDLQILGELCLWATAFAALGCVAAAHRATM